MGAPALGDLVDEWFSMTPTGRQLREPTATLHEVEDNEGVRHTILAFDAAYRGHTALTRGIKLVESFLEHPMVVGLVDLKAWNAQNARFLYPTGYFFTLKDLFRIYADTSMVLGMRAGLELGYLVGQILVEASENGASQGAFCHGGLTPWRIGLRPEGDVIVIGYGLPQMDIASYVRDSSYAVSPDSARYAPPERLTGQPEGIYSDTASVVAIAYEAITGQPLYNSHDIEALIRSVSLAEAATVLSRPNALPRPVASFFAQSLIYDPDSRLTGAAWLAQMAELHAGYQQGESLMDVAARVRGMTSESSRRPARVLSNEEVTRAIQAPRPLPTDTRPAAPATASTEPAKEQPKPETRWSRPVRRSLSASGDEPAQPASTATPALSPPPEATEARRRRRAREEGEPDLPPPAELGAEDDEEEAPAEPVDRLRRRADAPTDSLPTRRRRRRDEPAG